MFSHSERCIYNNNFLVEVICQLRFPEILSIDTTLPDRFQDAIRDTFPIYSVRKENIHDRQTNNHQFATQDGTWRINLTSRFISLSCNKYRCWEEFAGILDKPLAAFIQIYSPAFFERAGLRYLNILSRKNLGLDALSFSQLIMPPYSGILAKQDINEANVSLCSLDTDVALRGGCRLKLHSGPGKVTRNGLQDPEIKFILDEDLYMQGNIPVNTSAAALQTLHSQAYSIFRGAISDTLHDAMQPQ